MASKTDSKGNPVVTPEMIKKAGFTNLQDYLNDKKGLARRDGKPVMRAVSDADVARARAKTAEAKKPTPMNAATSARVDRNTLEQRAAQGKDMSQGARNMEGYKPRRSGSPLAPRTVEPTKPKAKQPEWASRHLKKGNK